MRLILLVFTAALIAAPASAQQAAPSPASDKSLTDGPAAQDTSAAQNAALPVSIAKIKEALQQPPSTFSLRSIDERPTFRVQIRERQKIEGRNVLGSKESEDETEDRNDFGKADEHNSSMNLSSKR